MVETKAPPVLLLPPAIEETQEEDDRPQDAKPYKLRGDFLFHCHVEPHMAGGLAGLVRSQQTVWLTPAQKQELETTVGLPLDPGDNACPVVQLDRCAQAVGGKWEELPNLPQITFMHAVLLANSNRVLYWGYGPRPDQTRLWDQTTGLYTSPATQPAQLHGDQNIWSGAHAHLNDAHGTVLVHGGNYLSGYPQLSPDTERRAFLFDPDPAAAAQPWALAADMHRGRFYPTTITLADGKPLTLFGTNQGRPGEPRVNTSFEIYTPGAGGGAWSDPKEMAFNPTYLFYPWTFLLPGGDLFIAGPQKPSRRFNPSAPMIDDMHANLYQQSFPFRGTANLGNMEGTAVLLPLKPPHHEPRVVILGGSGPAMDTAEWIDLSVAAPAWEPLPTLNIGRDRVNSVLLPDGRVMVAGGVAGLPDGGPVEIFDPEDPTAGFQIGPSMKHRRGYHSAAILLPDGSVIMGGDPSGDVVPNERYRPSYFFKPRPTITASPANIAYGAAFSVQTPTPRAIAEVVLMRAGAVTHGFNHNQRYIGCAITGTTGSQVQATAPPDGTVAPPGHYLLFLVDNDRIPSTGTWIRLA